MKIRVCKLYSFIICLILLLDFNLWYLFKLPTWLFTMNSKSNKFLIVILILLMYIDVLFTKQASIRAYRYQIRYSLILVLAVVFLSVSTAFMYTAQGINSTIRIANVYLVPLLVIPILYIYEKDRKLDSLVRMAEFATFLWYIVAIVQYNAYNFSGTVFLHDFFGSEGEVALRNNTIRLTMFAFGNTAVIYNFYKLICGDRRRIWHASNLILGIICVALIQKTRMFYLADTIGVMVVLFFSGKAKNARLRNITILVVAIFYLFASGMIEQFLSSIFVGNDVYKLNSTEVRVDAIGYYIARFLQNPLTGMGFVSESKYPTLVHGPLMNFYLSDVGFVGVLAQTGIFSIVIYVMPLIRMINVSKLAIKSGCAERYCFQIALTVYFLITSISIAATVPGCAVGFAFAIAYTEIVKRQIHEMMSF